MTSIECLEAAARVEDLAQSLYSALAIRYGDRPDLRELFSGLAMEEEQHANRLRSLAQHPTNQDLSDASKARLVRALNLMEAELAALSRTGADGRRLEDPDEILRGLVDFECRSASIHAEYLAQDFAPGMQSLFSALARKDRDHVELLRQALNGRAG